MIVVANGRAGEKPNCVNACVDCLDRIRSGAELLHLDSLGLILEEYGRQCQYGTPRGVGDVFVVWASTHRATLAKCETVSIQEDSEWEFAEFPHDDALRAFDRSDRKFVAVAIASGVNPVIYNATDSDWSDFAVPLAKYVAVVELCAGDERAD
ncbi:MAG: hypothetical protein SFX74_12315 [Fimbriimonadaceae bacterium]|nr:hypothetical protein [Fimbriimonadaceae bacterium]